MDWPLELIVVPVSDVDRAKTFYLEQAGFNVDVDHRGGEDFRVVQLTPPGSACSIALMRNTPAAGSLQGRTWSCPTSTPHVPSSSSVGTDVSEVFHFASGGQQPGPDLQRSNDNSFLSFSDPDGNGWLVREVRRTEPAA